MITSRVEVTAPDDSVMQARALLVSVVLTLLIMEHLVKKLRLAQCHSNLKINRVAGFNVCPKGTIRFKVAGVRDGRSRSRGRPPSFPRSQITYHQFLFLSYPAEAPV